MTDRRPDELNMSPEVAEYLRMRGIPLPDCPPTIKTPEAGEILSDAYFDPKRVDRVLTAFSRLRHTKGKHAGEPLTPSPWQVAYLIAPVFGWVRQNEDGTWVRIVREAYVDVPRKNGKSTVCGGIGLYLTAADGEAGAEVLAAATTERQAGYVFEPVRQLARSSPALKPHVKALAKRIVHPASGSYFTVVSSVAEALHGANVHGAIVDELHVHSTGELVETIETGTGSREQPLVVIITTADDGQTDTIYARKRSRVEQLADRTITHPSVYGAIWCADEQDDPFAESTWQKANPGFGISPTREYLATEADKAQDDPAALATFLRLHLGVRSRMGSRFLELDEWDRNAGMVREPDLAGRVAYGGLDLGSTSDLTSLCWLFPDGSGGFDALWRIWAPEERLRDLDKRTAGAASAWHRQGVLRTTEGNVTDYEAVKEQIFADLDTFQVAELAFDPWNATDLTNRLQAEGAPMVQVRQGYASLSPPLKEIKRLLAEGSAEHPRLRHGGNPAVRWMLGNLTVAMDPAGNVKPDKAKAAEKIDALSALVTSMARAVHHKPPRRSAYEDATLEVI